MDPFRSGSIRPGAPFSGRVSPEKASIYLRSIPAGDRDVWIKIGGVLKDEFGDAGFAIWGDWSQTSNKYRAKDTVAVWRSLGKSANPAGIGSLIYLARQCGWRSDAPPASRHEPSSMHKPPPRETRDTGAYAARLWRASQSDDAVVGSHPYAVKKGIPWAAGAGRGIAGGRQLGRDADCVIVPIRADGVGKLQGVQCINVDGVKQTFGAINGGCLVLGNTLNTRIPWYVAEGWASAVSMVFHHSRGNAVCAVAFGKSGLMPTAEMLSRVFDPDEVLVLQEQDK